MFMFPEACSELLLHQAGLGEHGEDRHGPALGGLGVR